MQVLVVEDELLLAEAITRVLKLASCRVDVVTNAPAAIVELKKKRYDALIVDLYLPEPDGWRVLDASVALADPPGVIMTSGRASVSIAVEAMRRGAKDFLTKPLDLGLLAQRVSRVLGSQALGRRNAASGARPWSVAASPAMARVFDLADRVARTPSSSALILGESGVGKEVVAARIHHTSARRAAPFVRVNLPAIAETMIEAELFGSVRGSFTDAKRDRAGLFASADKGTILLDELCEFRVGLQSKLLRVLEERRFYPVGSDQEREVDVRVIAATNQDPERAVDAGLLREDLYYRLATVVIHVPPLRDRPEDIVPLATHFLARTAQAHARPNLAFTQAAELALLRREWRGNVRELRNVIEHAVLVSDGEEIDIDAIVGARLSSSSWRAASTAPSFKDEPSTGRRRIAEPASPELSSERGLAYELQNDPRERALIEQALRETGGSRSRAAVKLGISRTTLWEKIKRHGLG